MKKLALGSPVDGKDVGWAHRALKTIERASFEDAETIFDDLTITGTITELRTIDAGETNQDTIRDFFLTLVSDIQKRGQNRDGG